MAEDYSDDSFENSEQAAPQLRARVPDHVSEGVFSTGTIVMTGPNEFVLDFVQTLGKPQRVASRIVMPHAVMPQFIEALRKNIEIYSNRFGPPLTPTPQAPAGSSTEARNSLGETQSTPGEGATVSGEPQPAPGEVRTPPADVRRPSPQEIYDELKISDSLLSGCYANGVMIGHGPTEFSLDFLTSFFPQSAVSSRVFLSSGQAPRLLESLQSAWNGFRNRGNPPESPGLSSS